MAQEHRPTVVLDIGGVLEITPDTGWSGRWERRLGLPEGAVRDRLWHVWRAGAIGGITEAEVDAAVTAELGLDAAQLVRFNDGLWDEYLGTPNVKLMGYVRGLRGRCGLGILSNSFVGAREREQQAYGFDELVDHIVYSHEIGVEKPDPRAYEITCDRLTARPADCLFIDDAPVNVEAARAAGMRALLFEDNATTIAAIEAHLAAHPSNAVAVEGS
jgi:FMN phosphatase YigB (HAD superfamily)